MNMHQYLIYGITLAKVLQKQNKFFRYFEIKKVQLKVKLIYFLKQTTWILIK